MSDDQLIAEVARVWADGGGDAEGLDWCHQKLKEAVNAEIENRVMQEQEREQEREIGRIRLGPGPCVSRPPIKGDRHGKQAGKD